MNYTLKLDGIVDPNILSLANFHFSRGLQVGDRRHEERFWYARGLFLNGDGEEARKQFQLSKQAHVSNFTKRTVKGLVRDVSGPVAYIGELVDSTDYRGYIRCIDLVGDVFMFTRDAPIGLREGDIITFSLAFNYHGPIATNVEQNLL